MKIKGVTEGIKSLPWALCALMVMGFISFSYAAGELETQIANIDTKIVGKGGKVLLGAAATGGGLFAAFKGQIMLGLAILGSVITIAISKGIIDADLKIW
jgi:hypothetical protein